MAGKGRLVFEGKIFKVYQWRQRMFDGSYRTFERAERPSAAQIVAVVDGKITVGAESQPGRKRFIGLLGGSINRGETPLQAAKRELLEESGMTTRRWRLLRRFTSPGKMQFDDYLFAALDCKKTAKPKLGNGERITVRLITVDELVGWKEGTARIGCHVALYLAERRYDAKLREKFIRELGLKR
jgi:ADP-ribose pyrophosphatase